MIINFRKSHKPCMLIISVQFCNFGSKFCTIQDSPNLRIFSGISNYKNFHCIMNILSKITIDHFSSPYKKINQVSSNIIPVVYLKNARRKQNNL